MTPSSSDARGPLSGRLLSHCALPGAAAILWFFGLLIPFISGSKNLLIASPSRSYSLVKFTGYLFDHGQAVVAIAILLFLVAAPLALFALLVLNEEHPTGRKRRRLAIAACALLVVDFIFLIAIRAGVDEKATPHLLPGFWLLSGALLLAAAGASYAAWGRRIPHRHGLPTHA